jgi:nucleoid DNA-binding protein
VNPGKYISELLLFHDCVIIPGLGGFVGNYAPASIDPVKNIFSPPHKQIAFNINLKSNDGLLINHLSLRENIPFAEAGKEINSFVFRTLESLKKGKKIEVNGVGTLYFNKNNKLSFEPTKGDNLLLNSFGLTDFHSPLIKRDKEITRIEKKFKDRTISAKPAKSKLKWLAVSLAMMPIIASFAWFAMNPEILKEMPVSYTSLNPFSSKVSTVYTLSERSISEIKIATDDLDETISENIVSHEEPVVIEKPEPVTEHIEEVKAIETSHKEIKEKTKAKPVTESIVNENTGNFYIIGGCFQEMANAENFKNSLVSQGFSASVHAKSKGLYRVSYNGFSNRDEAVTALVKIKSINKDAWILSN